MAEECTINALPLEIHLEILRYTNIQTMGRMNQLNRYWHELVNPSAMVSSFEKARREHCAKLRNYNPYWKYLEQQDHAKLHWADISSNSNITIDVVLNNLHCPWDYSTLAKNSNITMEIILSTPEIAWQLDRISQNPNITIHDVVSNHNLSWDFDHLAANIHFAGIFLDDPEPKRSMMSHLSRNAAISLEKILKIMEYTGTRAWNWRELTKNPAISLHDVINNPKLPWNYDSFSYRPDLTIEFVRATPHIQYNWDALSASMKLTIDDVIKYLELPWNYGRLSCNPNISVNDMQAHPSLPWRWSSMNNNMGLTIHDVLKYPIVVWYWPDLSKNPGITMADILAHPELPWEPYHVSLR